jgi:hypothetical protein
MSDGSGNVHYEPIMVIRAQLLGKEFAMLEGSQVGARVLRMLDHRRGVSFSFMWYFHRAVKMRIG